MSMRARDEKDQVALTVALAGDTMLGRGVGEVLARNPRAELVAPEVIDVARRADLFVVNLECCISSRGERFPDPRKPFFFRAPAVAAQRLADIGVDCVTLANNHALDFGEDALLDTIEYLERAGIAWMGAGPDRASARTPRVLVGRGMRLRVVAVTDHPATYAAAPDRPGVAYADLRHSVPEWLRGAVRPGPDADAVLVTPHWGPNMTPSPVPYVRAAAATIVSEGATLIAGHSAHVVHGIAGPVLYDLGDFIDDYRVDPERRNDLGMLFVVSLDARGPRRLEALPLRLQYAHTRLAESGDAALLRSRFRRSCAALGTDVHDDGGRMVVDYADPDPTD
jgi:poly-gamma-glutamate capsule biosynthesis protein CapA/YwtB (metallophosphatase superfamily)